MTRKDYETIAAELKRTNASNDIIYQFVRVFENTQNNFKTGVFVIASGGAVRV